MEAIVSYRTIVLPIGHHGSCGVNFEPTTTHTLFLARPSLQKGGGLFAPFFSHRFKPSRVFSKIECFLAQRKTLRHQKVRADPNPRAINFAVKLPCETLHGRLNFAS